ncbi:phage tail tube protein [Enterococcus songbeiensis]|uniref:phage tail tube protein n=1 Tax=Enterococcus songbeiensis TaxID=2559927 RepID=UPI0010F89F2C|nr:phage tail protein [Enterococcus songbeiensis]
MARTKNALTGYFIQPITETNREAATEAEWLELAKFISNVDDASNEESEATGYYDGDGNPEDEVLSHQLGHSFTGFYDDSDPAMSAIEAMIGKNGDGRKIWYKVVKPTKDKERVGKATVKEPVAQVGDATAFGDFSCTITFDSTPEWTPVTPVSEG